MFCHKCGTELADTVKFCHICGTPTQQAPYASFEALQDLEQTQQSRGIPRRLLIFGGVLGGALLLIGLALMIAYFALGLQHKSDIAAYVPDDTTAVVVISPSLLQLPQVRDTNRLVIPMAPLAMLFFTPGMSSFAFHIANDYGYMMRDIDIDVNEDILPWIGREVGLALIDADEGDIVIAAAVRNKDRAQAFLAELQGYLESQGVEFSDSVYGGAKLTEVTTMGMMPLAFTITDSRLLVASDRRTLEDALAQKQSGRNSLAKNDAFRHATRAHSSNRLGYFYIDQGAFNDSVLLSFFGDLGISSPVRWNSGAFSLANNGVHFYQQTGYQTSKLTRAQRRWMEQESVDNSLAKQVPEGVTLYLSAGGSPANMLEFVADILPEFQDFLDEVDEELGLFQLMKAMTGDFALATWVDDRGLSSELFEGAGILLVSQTEDNQKVKRTLENTFASTADELRLEFKTDRIAGYPAGSLFDDWSEQYILGYALTDNTVVVGTSENLVEEAITPRYPLADDSRFKATFRALPKGGNFYVYADIKALFDFLGAEFEDMPGVKYIEQIEAMGAVSKPLSRSGEVESELFFLTKPPRR